MRRAEEYRDVWYFNRVISAKIPGNQVVKWNENKGVIR
jgi:hypothetical protein